MHSLYDQFQKTVIEEGNIWGLKPFQKKTFWKRLSESEKKKLASLFLKRAKASFSSTDLEDLLFESLRLAESLLPSDLEVLCQEAFILYTYGVLYSKENFYFLALNKFLKAKESDLAKLKERGEWLHLWGNIWISLGRCKQESYFLQQGLKKYEQAAQVNINPKNRDFLRELYWDWGEAWTLMGRWSGEPFDLQQGIEKLARAAELGCYCPFFYIAYGEALVALGRLKGEPPLLEQAILFLQMAIKDSYFPEKETSEAHIKAWVFYAQALKYRFEMTHSRDHFQKADKVFREAIIMTPNHTNLWLGWGELYLHSGWLNHDLKEVETALDKLASSKVKECDPLLLSALLGKGLALLGLCLDDFHSLSEGIKRITATLELVPDHAHLLSAAGIAYVGYGIYFSEPKHYAKAVAYFEKSLQKDATDVESWYGLFQAYLEWGMSQKDASLVNKGLQAIKRITCLRPKAALYYNEWGIALLRLRHLESNSSSHHKLIIEALDLFKRGWALQEEIDILYNWGCTLDLLGDITANDEDYEEAIEILTKVYTKEPHSQRVCYRLALALSHYGELTSQVESLYRAIELFKWVSPQDENVLCDFGYALLNLSELIYDSNIPQQAMSLRKEAEKKLMEAAELGSGEAFYHLACLYSLSGFHDVSIHYLKRAEVMNCLPPIEDIEHDEWLEKIHHTRAFQEFLMTRKQKK